MKRLTTLALYLVLVGLLVAGCQFIRPAPTGPTEAETVQQTAPQEQGQAAQAPQEGRQVSGQPQPIQPPQEQKLTIDFKEPNQPMTLYYQAATCGMTSFQITVNTSANTPIRELVLEYRIRSENAAQAQPLLTGRLPFQFVEGQRFQLTVDTQQMSLEALKGQNAVLEYALVAKDAQGKTARYPAEDGKWVTVYLKPCEDTVAQANVQPGQQANANASGSAGASTGNTGSTGSTASTGSASGQNNAGSNTSGGSTSGSTSGGSTSGTSGGSSDPATLPSNDTAVPCPTCPVVVEGLVTNDSGSMVITEIGNTGTNDNGAVMGDTGTSGGDLGDLPSIDPNPSLPSDADTGIVGPEELPECEVNPNIPCQPNLNNALANIVRSPVTRTVLGILLVGVVAAGAFALTKLRKEG